ncbi:tyrosine-protein kinase SRK2-like [Sycon ciliatum]|uniref:tyrosine-protein kinase SRK2-like n=1 Tax=Sycon ciliatum TaxID=27933 RepID=UPI0031F63F31
MEEEELKCSRMVKRSQGKKKIGVVNYKERIFVLTPRDFTYYEGSLIKRGKAKGTIQLKDIKAVEKVDQEAFNKKFSFQVIYEEFVLYIIASTSSELDEWLAILRKATANNAGLLSFFHPGIFASNKWTCCHHGSRHSLGCKATFASRQKSTTSTTMTPTTSMTATPTINTNTNSVTKVAPATSCLLPPEEKLIRSGTYVGHKNLVDGIKPFDVIAIYNYSTPQPGDLALAKGQRFTVFDDRREHWWHAENSSAVVGFIPSNYVRRIGITSEPWFYSDLSRQRAENILRDDGKEGCFLIRNSSKGGMYTLSLLHGDAVRHYHIRQDDSNFYFISDNHHFETIPELVEYHSLNGGGLVTRLRRPPRQDNPMEPPTRDKWEINPGDLTFGRELGSGQFGRVVEGKYKGKTDVAIKMMREGTMDEDDFIEEAKVMKNFQHPNLVQLYGVVTVQKPILIITELMENGCLLDFLRKNKQILERPGILIDMCIQVASAMQFLEDHRFIHRDLAARNCLVKDRMQVKVGDFGLARHVMDDEYTASEGTKFPIKWASPEVISYAKFSSKSDVWAFGVLIWELYTGGMTPYPSFSNTQVVDEILKGYRLERPPNCPGVLFEVVKKTWQQEPEDRPTFAEIHRMLTEFGADYSDPA